MNPTTAFIRCADLVRDCDPALQSQRVGIRRGQNDLTIGATDGHVAIKFDFNTGGNYTPGSYTAIGADFPKWGSCQWQIQQTADALECEARTSKGKRTMFTSRRDTRVELRAEQAIGVTCWELLGVGKRDSAGDVHELGEIRDALELLHEDVAITMATDLTDGCLSIVAGPLVARTRLALDLPAPMRFNVGVLDRALGLLEGLDGGGLIWDFPARRLDPLVIRPYLGAKVAVLAMPLD